MIYVALTFWIILLSLAGVCVYRLWRGIIGPAWCGWIFFPGTLVSYLGYSGGFLVSGGSRSDLPVLPLGAGGGNSDGRKSSAFTVRTVIASLFAIVAAVGIFILAYFLLDDPDSIVVRNFHLRVGYLVNLKLPKTLPQALPESWSELWDMLHQQIELVRRTLETMTEIDWSDWRAWVFVYLTVSLGVHVCPVRRSPLSTIVACVIIGAILAGTGAISEFATDKIAADNTWYLLTYLWSCVLTLLAISIAAYGIALAIKNRRTSRREKSSSD